MLTRFFLATIPHAAHRIAGQVGDWQIGPNDSGFVFVSEMDNPDHAFLLIAHEIIEMYLCARAGISTETVDEWDRNYTGEFEQEGDDPQAPYHRQHMVASRIEEALAAEMGVDFEEYGLAIGRVLGGNTSTT